MGCGRDGWAGVRAEKVMGAERAIGCTIVIAEQCETAVPSYPGECQRYDDDGDRVVGTTAAA